MTVHPFACPSTVTPSDEALREYTPPRSKRGDADTGLRGALMLFSACANQLCAVRPRERAGGVQVGVRWVTKLPPAACQSCDDM